MIVLPKGSHLYRAAEEYDYFFMPHYDPDTGKTGCYFSYNDPFLSDSMAIEYNKTLKRGEFVTKDDIVCYDNKYSYRILPPGSDININHIDFEIGALVLDDDPSKNYAEVFLTKKELDKLKIIDLVEITPEDMTIKYKQFLRPKEYYS